MKHLFLYAFLLAMTVYILDRIDDVCFALREQQGTLLVADFEGISVAARVTAQEEVDGDFSLL